ERRTTRARHRRGQVAARCSPSCAPCAGANLSPSVGSAPTELSANWLAAVTRSESFVSAHDRTHYGKAMRTRTSFGSLRARFLKCGHLRYGPCRLRLGGPEGLPEVVGDLQLEHPLGHTDRSKFLEDHAKGFMSSPPLRRATTGDRQITIAHSVLL